MNRYARIAATTALLVTTLGTASAEQWIFRGIGGPEPVVRNIRTFSNYPVAGTTTLYLATLGLGVVRVEDEGLGPVGFSPPVQLNNGLPSRRIRNVSGPGASPGVLYAATEAHGLYRTTDGGANWSSANGSGGNALPCRFTRNTNVINATEVYAATGCQYASGVYRTIDSGATWTHIATSGIPDDVVVNSVSIDSTSGAIYVATSNYGLLKGTLGGTFAPSNGTGANKFPDQGGPGRLSVFNVVVRSPNTTLLAYVPGGGVFRSLDSGVNWSTVNGTLPTLFSHGGLSGDGLGSFYFHTEKSGIWKTTDNGDNWAPWGTSSETDAGNYSRQLTRDGASDRYYISRLGGFSRANSAGTAFSIPKLGSSHVTTLDMITSRRAYVTDHAPFYAPNMHTIGSDCGSTCPTEIFSNLPGATIDGQIGHAPGNEARVYVSSNYYGLWRSDNAGASSAQLPLPFNPGELVRFTIASENAQVMLAGLTNPFSSATGGGIYKSIDGGTSWAPFSTGLDNPDARHINRITVPPDGNLPYFAATEGGVYRSTDGTTWSLVNSALDGGGKLLGSGFVTRHATNPLLVYASNDHVNSDGTILPTSGIIRSTDGGNTWTNVLPGRRVRQVRQQGDGTIFAVIHREIGTPQLLRSTDTGNTWSSYSNGLPLGEARSLGQLGSPSFKVVAVNDTSGIYTQKPADTTVDFNADGRADITWKDPDGQAAIWMMNGTSVTGSALVLGPATGWTVVENDGDYNGDGFADLLWGNIDGRWAIWLMNGTTPIGSALIFGGGGGWQVTNIGDFNGDGRTDLVWRDSNNQVALWLMDGVNPIGSAVIFGPGTSWQVTRTGDFNGDGLTDLLFKDAAGQLSMWLMNGTNVIGSGIIYGGGAFSVPIVGDFNGDGMTDLVFTDAGNTVAIWLMNGLTPMSSGVIYGGGPFQLTFRGDFNGDGRTDLVFRDPGGQVSVWLLDGLSVTGSAIIFGGGGGWNVFRTADFDGDGNTDLMWVDGGGQVALWMMNGVNPAATGVIFGGNGGWVIQPN